MKNPLRVACAGIGNNISALHQGVIYYRSSDEFDASSEKWVGIRNNDIGGISVGDVQIVAGFEVHADKVGRTLEEAIFTAPNNYVRLPVELPASGVVVRKGIYYKDGVLIGMEEVVRELIASEAEVLLYSLPTGLQWAADAYAECALEAGVGFVNCTPEIVARSPEMMRRFEELGLPLIGDDLASHMGTSMLHREIIELIVSRGLDLESTFQINLGGNEDFRNLRENGGSKAVSKKNALAQMGLDLKKVEVIPSAGVINSLGDRKVAFINVVARGWANTPVHIDLKLDVQDSSNAAGVIIDLIRICGLARRKALPGFNAAAASFLKSPPGGHGQSQSEDEKDAFLLLNEA